MIKTPAQSTINYKLFFKNFKNNLSTLKSLKEKKNIFWAQDARGLLINLLIELKNKYNFNSNDEVLFSGFTCASVPSAIIQSGLAPVSYDTNYEGLSPNANSVKSKITSRTKVLIIQNLFGLFYDNKDFLFFCKNNDIILIDDRSQSSICHDYFQKDIDFILYSFGRGKFISAHGGGMLICNKTKFVLKNTLKNNFLSFYFFKILFVNFLSRPIIFWIINYLFLGKDDSYYQKIKPSNIDWFNKYVSICLFNDTERLSNHRRKISAIYIKYLPSELLKFINQNIQSTYLRFPIFVNDSSFDFKSLNNLGIRKSYKEIDFIVDEKILFKKSCQLSNNLYTLPTHEKISKIEAMDIVRRVKKELNYKT